MSDTLEAELLLTRELVAKLNSTGLVREGLVAAPPDLRSEDILLKEELELEVDTDDFLASLFLMLSRSITCLTIFCP